MRAPLTRIGDLCQQIRGVSYDGAEASDSPAVDKLPVLRANNITDEGLAFDDLVFVPRSRISEKQMLRRGDIVIAASSGSLEVVGKAAMCDRSFEGSFGAFCKALRPSDVVDPLYLSYFFRSPVYRHTISHLAAGANINNLRNEHLNDLRIPLPPLPEQKRIAAILSKADAIRRKRRESLHLLDDFLRSVFLDMFGDPVTNPKGWPISPLGILSEIQGGLQVTSARSINPVEVPYLRVANVFRDRMDLHEIKTIRVTKEELKRATLEAGDVMVVEGHGNPEEIGRSSVWDGSIKPCVHQNHLIRVRPDGDQLLPLFLSMFLNSAGGKRQMVRAGKTTSGLNTISTSNVKAVQVPLPPLDVQRHLVRSLDLAVSLRSQLTTSDDASDTLFHSLLQRAFRGEL